MNTLMVSYGPLSGGNGHLNGGSTYNNHSRPNELEGNLKLCNENKLAGNTDR